MKDKFKNTNVKENLGITLVALVITIIILLILAGITISQLSNSGLFGKSQEAKEKWDNVQNYEETEIAKYSNEMEGHLTGGRLYSDSDITQMLANYQRTRSNTSIDVPLNALSGNVSVTSYTAPTDGYYIIRTNVSNINSYAMCNVYHYTDNTQTVLIEQVNTGGQPFQENDGFSMYLKKDESIKIIRQCNVTVQSSKFWYADGCVPET